MSRRILSEDAYRFRRAVIDALVVDGAAGYVTQDSFAGRCPHCAGDAAFRFHGHAQRVTVRCLDGCSEAEIGDKLDLAVRP